MATHAEQNGASMDHMHAAVPAAGTPEQKQRADALLNGYKNVGIGLAVSLDLHRAAMRDLLAAAQANTGGRRSQNDAA